MADDLFAARLRRAKFIAWDEGWAHRHNTGALDPHPNPYADPADDMWQRSARLRDGTRILITVWDHDPATMEVAQRVGGRWSAPLEVWDPT